MTRRSAVQILAPTVKIPLAKTLNPELGFWATVKVLKITLKC